MFGMHLAGGDRTPVANMKRFGFALAGDGNLAADYHDSGVPIVRVIAVHLPGL
jgi:hypothetical protein